MISRPSVLTCAPNANSTENPLESAGIVRATVYLAAVVLIVTLVSVLAPANKAEPSSPVTVLVLATNAVEPPFVLLALA